MFLFVVMCRFARKWEFDIVLRFKFASVDVSITLLVWAFCLQRHSVLKSVIQCFFRWSLFAPYIWTSLRVLDELLDWELGGITELPPSYSFTFQKCGRSKSPTYRAFSLIPDWSHYSVISPIKTSWDYLEKSGFGCTCSVQRLLTKAF